MRNTIPLTSAKSKKKGGVQLAFWNAWGVSKERMDYLFGSEDKTIEGLFPAGKGDWVVGLGECHRREQEICDAWGKIQKTGVCWSRAS